MANWRTLLILFQILGLHQKTLGGIIAQLAGVICFVEVKARHSLSLGAPQEAVSLRKQRQIGRVAVYYLKSRKLLEQPARFDVLALLYANSQPQISLIKDAFELSANLTV